MIIQWLGQSCFKIQGKGEAGQEVTVIIDPFAPSIGKKLPRNCTADILLITHEHPGHAYREGVLRNPFVIAGPGEYETKGVFVYGIKTFHDREEGKKEGTNTLYHLTMEGITLVHCGDLGHALTEEQLGVIEDAHILCVPVGGGKTLDAKGAAEVASQIEPRIIIPMHYALPGLTVKLDSVDRFCREMGASAAEKPDKLRVTIKDLPQEEVRVVVLAAL